MKSKLAAAVVAFTVLALPQGALSSPSPGLIGISPQDHPNEPDYRLMEEAGVQSVRLPLFWSQVEPTPPFIGGRDWTGFDGGVRLAARHELSVLAVVVGSPPWIASEPRLEPARRWQWRAWASFLHAAVRRYGAGGSFWRENPDLPYVPVRLWLSWNEGEHRHLRACNPELFASPAVASRRLRHPRNRPGRQGDPRRAVRPAAADPAQRELRRLSQPRLSRQAHQAVLRRGSAHPYVADAACDARPDSPTCAASCGSTTTPPRRCT